MVLVFKIDRKEINCLIKENGGYKSPIFDVKYKINPSKDANFVFVVSKKEEKRANKRNSIKRRTKEAFRRVFYGQNVGIKGVVFCRKSIQNKVFSDILEEVERFKKKLVF